MAFSNGAFPKSATTALATAPGQRLEPTAARQWDALALSVQHQHGWIPVLTDSYRPYSVQERIFRERYRVQRSGSGPYGDVRYWQGMRWVRVQGAAAAVPGTSNHGWAKAVDCSGLGGFGGARYKQLAALAPRFGFTNTEGRSVGEAWHWVFTGTYSVSKPIGGTGSVATPNLPGAPAPITPEDDMFSDEDRETLQLVRRIVAENQRRTDKGIAISTENQRRIDQVKTDVWNVSVKRDGKSVPVIQELADAKTLSAQARGEADGLRAALTALAAGKGLTVEQITAAAKAGAEAAIKGGVKVTIDVPKEG